jgi:hypothetical protein
MAGRKRSRWRFESGKQVKAECLSGEIDLLAWTPDQADEVLLVEYKAILEASDTNEIHQATRLMQEGQAQLRRCIDILALLSVEEKNAIFRFVPWIRVRSAFGIVVSSGGNPAQGFDHSEFPAITHYAFTRKLRPRDFLGPSRLWRACRDHDWLDMYDAVKRCSVETRIGGLTYSLPWTQMPDS